MKSSGSVEVQVAGLTIDPFTNMPIVVLRDLQGTRQLPIWIGLVEASSIATQLEKVELARPMTHDLMKTLLETTGTTLDRVEVTELKDDTFYANLHLTVAGKPVVIDSRPSDAIALALRTGARIFVSNAVLEKSRRVEEQTEAKAGSEGEPQPPVNALAAELAKTPPSKWAELLEKMSPDSFGKFKM